MKEALLVIDVQNEYFSGSLPITYPTGTLKNILLAMDAAHAAKIPVLIIQHINKDTNAPTFRQGTDASELHPEIKKRPYDLLIQKAFPGSFTDTCLGDWLSHNSVCLLTISGYMTQMCCDTTARQGYHRGYAVKFLSDATGTLTVANKAGMVQDSDLHRAVLVTQQSKFSHVMTTSEWIHSLSINYK